ncbi:MAG: DUF2029 domain-containing protein [Acidimicrobiia bacterium]|nr:DUF2029 domain-containing protein [Acidimicrobiia bacterium]
MRPTLLRAAPLVFLVVLAAMTVRLLAIVVEPGASDGGYLDFRDAVHAPAAALLDGVDPYNTVDLLAHDPDIGNPFNTYTPHHLLLAIPLALLPIWVAGVIWWGLNVALLLIAVRFAVERTRPEWGWDGVFGVASIVLLSNPGRFNFLTGQPTLVIVVGAYVAFTSRNPWAAAAGAAAAAIKPQFGIPLFVLLAAAGRLRTALGGTGIVAALSAPILLTLVAIEGSVGGVIDAIWDNATAERSGSLSPYRIDAVAAGRRVLGFDERFVITVLVFALFMGIGWYLLRRRREFDATAMAIVGLTSLLALFHLPYDELILLWPIVGLVTADHGLGRWRPWAVGAMLAAAFNPLTMLILDLGEGLDTTTTVLLALSLAAIAAGMLARRERETPVRQ